MEGQKTLQFPIKKPTESEMLDDWEALNVSPILPLSEGDWFARNTDVTGNLYLPASKVGMKASNYFHFDWRMCCDSINSPSAIRSWFSPKFHGTLKNCKFYEENPSAALALRKYIPSQFRPDSGRSIVSHFGSKKWYDPCGGWGDRMLAAQSLGIEYHCRDVNPFVMLGYERQVQTLSGSTSNITFELKGSEKDCPLTNHYDLVFTSPPYWDVEKYQGSLQEQSHRHRKFNLWLDGFLKPMMHHAYDSLISGGVFALNVGNVYCHHQVNDIVSEVIKFCEEQSGNWGALGYKMTQRPNSKATQGEGVFCEPIIWTRKI